MNDPIKRRLLDAIMAAGVPGFTRETAALMLDAIERAPAIVLRLAPAAMPKRNIKPRRPR